MMETAFTPFQSLAGGALIGLAAVLLIGLFGRIFGATGILSGLLVRQGSSDTGWRVALIAGMVSAPLLYALIAGRMPDLEVPASVPMLITGGFLVGIGVTIGGGCTSGHGVCGLARLSRRSFAATATFMAATAITVFVLRHMIGS